VLFGKWSGTEVKIDGEDLLIMKESDVMGVIEGAQHGLSDEPPKGNVTATGLVMGLADPDDPRRVIPVVAPADRALLFRVAGVADVPAQAVR